MVHRQRPAHRVPPHRGGLPFVRSGALRHRADQDRHPGHRGRTGHRGPGHRVEHRVDVGGVLRPEQEVGLRRPAEPRATHQVDGLGEMVVRDGTGAAEGLDAATGHVALDDTHRDRALAAGKGLDLEGTQPDPGDAQGRQDEHGRQHPRPDARTPLEDEQHHPGDDLTDEGDQEADASDADEREPAVQRRVDRCVREPGPAETTERDGRVRQLDRHPAGRCGDRPPPQARDEREGETEDAEEQGHEDDQHRRDPPAEDVHPGDGHREHGDAEQVAQAERPAWPAAAGQQRQRRDADEQQRPEGVRLPRQPGGHAGEHRRQSPDTPPHRTPRGYRDPPTEPFSRGPRAGRAREQPGRRRPSRRTSAAGRQAAAAAARWPGRADRVRPPRPQSWPRPRA